MKKVIKKCSIGMISACAVLFIWAGAASAHVTVSPKISAPGAWETYTLKVPVEKNIATTKVALKVPKGVEIMSYQPVPDWKVKLDKDSSGKTKIVTWEATGPGISAGQFQQFYFVAKNPDKETKAAWDAFQYYKDGSVVEWTGDENSDSPHSITEITASTGIPNVTVHDDSKDRTDKTMKKDTKSENSRSNTLVITLTIVSLILSAAALIMAMRKK
ncbi:YcnI family protein [Peribacillus sp. B-H-3]|jgi:uncharacterized protein YcnI|uniref:YcnI family copper-binding membrane protein n=1 Tax=Peribacillus sp. B-H-3 TaxID=3400420 RepID=UPI003B010AC9